MSKGLAGEREWGPGNLQREPVGAKMKKRKVGREVRPAKGLASRAWLLK